MIKRLIAEFLAKQTLPFRYTAGQLVTELDINPAAEYKRRHRELRDLGWEIQTYREDSALFPKEYLLTKIGVMPE